MKENDKKVYVGLSGGVDSSVTAAILKDQGHDVTGVFIDVWQPEFLECTSGADRHDAMRVCEKLNIPFKTFDAKELYKEKVVNYMVDEYRAGRTPNPDVMCNKYVKFGLFFDWALKEGVDLVATGHYCRTNSQMSKDEREEYHLLRGKDPNKDQSYFLWAVSQKVLSRTIFPVGEMKKNEVRDLAVYYDLPTAKKKDSQGICFLGKVDLKTFLSRYISPEPGDVLDEKGEVIGYHEGAWFYTIGQRHGFTVENKSPDSAPFYVIRKDVSNNTLVVSTDPKKESVSKVSLIYENWIPEGVASEYSEKVLGAVYRYRQPERECRISVNENETLVYFTEPQTAVAEGQSLVLYDSGRCIGGGIIANIYSNGI
ncbi:MAG: tRNA 2-thiouridine(34) synthase MnmA [Candidatus Paceibacterota bacterium]